MAIIGDGAIRVLLLMVAMLGST